jgi:acyl-CoA thioesterase
MDVREFFKKDQFANLTGIELLEIDEGYAKAMLKVEERHLNAGRTIQGGAIFSLADYVIGVACNAYGKLSFTLTGSMNFLRTSMVGDILYAEARERFLHKRIGCYQVDVVNQEGELVATMEATVYRKDIDIN